MAKPRIRTGRPYPLGATWDGKGVNFALYSAAADEVLLCLFDADGGNERQLALTHRQHHIWYGYVPDLAPGTLYAWRVKGVYDPAAGRRCNPHKLLLDPYARAIAGQPQWGPAHYAYIQGEEAEDFSCSLEDSAAVSPKCVVVDNGFDWQGVTRPRTPWAKTVMYEVHVKGFTQTHPDVPEDLRGTYAGMASAPAIAHLKRLGITAVELLPVHAFVDDHRLADLGLVNYWGYNSIGFFAPEARYAADQSPGGAVREFKQMVKALHEAGIEVILDVVYNHTAEGNHLGPTLSFKGIDHAAYYRLSPEDRRYNVDYTGCGNTLNTTSPVVIRLIMDSLRYWVAEMGVDGFRFDLASALGRGAVEFDPHSPFFTAIAQDPLLSTVKLIAEPWDLGPNGYRVGGYPHGWAEWNGAYRDSVRSFWCQREGHLTQLAQRLCGSADIYEPGGRQPTDSINLVTVHDGFTLADLTAYNGKHNEANGEENRDGENHNRGWNGGFEGATDDELVRAQRGRMRRNLMATLLLSQGTPLLLGGDEFGRTQGGNNNGYCQDNAISWFDWQPTPEGEATLAFTERLLALRRELPGLRRPRFFKGQPGPDGQKDLTWRLPDGSEMPGECWHDGGLTAVAAHLSRWAAVDDDEAGDEDATPAVLLLVNGGDEPAHFQLPAGAGEGKGEGGDAWGWRARIDTCTATGFPSRGDAQVEGGYTASGRSIVVLTQDVPRAETALAAVEAIAEAAADDAAPATPGPAPAATEPA